MFLIKAVPSILVFSFLSAIPIAYAQDTQNIKDTQTATNQSVSDQDQSESIESEFKDFIARPSQGIELPKQTATKFSTLIKKAPEGVTEDTTGVNLNGFIRYIPYEGKNYAQAAMTSISRGDIEIPLSDQEAVNGQFETEKLTLETTDDLKMKARPEVLNDALKKLAEAEKNAEDEKLEKEDAKPSVQTADSGSQSSGQTSSGAANSGSSFEAAKQQDFVDPKTEIKISTDGCAVRIDKAQNKAVQQNTTITLKDGVEQSRTACEDSLTSYALQTSFDGCSDIVEVSSLTVFRQSKTFYNKDGAQVPVSSCAKDTSATFAIVEETSGCAPVVNQAARKVDVYSKLVYTGATNAVIPVQNCQISRTQPAYDLQRSSESCTHDIDLKTKVASDRYKDFYIDKLGTRTEVSDCTVDMSKQWSIVEVEGSCKILLEFTPDEEKVFKQSVMQYTDDKGVLNEARGCDKSILSESVPMTKDTNLCSIRHDFPNEQSYQMFVWTYSLDNVRYQASACADTDVSYRHEKYTLDASGAKVCSANVDQDAKLVTLFYRTGITVDEKVQYITECTPDETNKLTVIATTDGCTDPASWQHDLAAQVSFENERWYYSLNNVREYVTPCQQGTKSYTHEQTIIGWQLQDDKLFGLPITKVEIDAPIGKYVVTTDKVLDGAVQKPYIYQETKDVLKDVSGRPTVFEGCSGFKETFSTEFYTRPNNTTFEKIIGEGVILDAGYVCDDRVAASKDFYYKYYIARVGTIASIIKQCGHGTGAATAILKHLKARYNKVEKYNIFNNTVLTTTYVYDSNVSEDLTDVTCIHWMNPFNAKTQFDAFKNLMPKYSGGAGDGYNFLYLNHETIVHNW